MISFPIRETRWLSFNDTENSEDRRRWSSSPAPAIDMTRRCLRANDWSVFYAGMTIKRRDGIELSRMTFDFRHKSFVTLFSRKTTGFAVRDCHLGKQNAGQPSRGPSHFPFRLPQPVTLAVISTTSACSKNRSRIRRIFDLYAYNGDTLNVAFSYS